MTQGTVLWALTAVATALLTASLFAALVISRYAAPFEMQMSTPVTRVYFVAAEETLWNYLPTGIDGTTGEPFNGNSSSATSRIGTVYKKCLYREYADANFTTRKPASPDWQHLGLLGPVLRAEVGDLVKVAFVNRCSFVASMHPHGLLYSKADEGVPMDLMTGGGGGSTMAGSDMPPALDPNRGDGSSIAPGSEHVYEWLVPERAGPGPDDPSSVMWPYHSHVDEVADVSSGLVGPVIVTRRGWATSADDLKPRDVDREFVVSLSIVDENLSHYLQDSMAAALVPPLAPEAMAALMADAEFQDSNRKRSINGYLYANLRGLQMVAHENVRWHAFSLGDEGDLHGAHWHGQTAVVRGSRTDEVALIPASVKAVDMVPDNPGRWLFHCRTNAHLQAGMTSYFDVVAADATTSASVHVRAANLLVSLLSLLLVFIVA